LAEKIDDDDDGSAPCFDFGPLLECEPSLCWYWCSGQWL